MTGLHELFDARSLHGRAYAALVQHPRSSLVELAEYLESPLEAVEASLERLCDMQAAVRIDTNGAIVWDAHAPEALSEAESRRRQVDTARMHAAAARLGETFRSVRRTARGDGTIVPMYEARELVAEFEDLQRAARGNVRLVERGPYVLDTDRAERMFELKSARIDAGIRYQTLYQDTIYQDPDRLRFALATNSAGAHARTLPDPPLKVLIVDGERACLMLHNDERRGDPMGLRIGPSPTLDLLVRTFDVLWSLAAPISVNPGEPLDERDRAILTLMGLGATDDTIARRLGMSRRTVVRRTASLLERLGASTRFQAGVQAIRRGWL
ncbi:DNA-binding CsgD family transcriptional regulator [Nocardia transvalensis]|uniref:DNA-binding CsgD family transcriptional regulator n=1 Tax=Nocardia transvalensis TaxID=37333 RepID=A0A7W9PBE8_9NOCA|nr:LuxR C-terminal-related transcriptional regulator [Nocardia transvalensis]MBB5912969.1 DNA-binding CsgD family transcriptional regulator [Nocardia transvalensis]